MSDLVDDPQISNSERLLRRIAPQQIIDDPNGCKRPSSAAFSQIEMSVYLESKKSSEEVLSSYPNHSLVSFTAEFVRSLDCIIVQRADDPDPAHVLVCPKINPSKGLTKSKARTIAKEAKWVVLKSY